MNKFTKFTDIIESRKTYDSGSLLSSEINKYLNKVNKAIPKAVQDVIYLTQKYNLLDANSVEEIRTSNKSGLKKLAEKYNIPSESLENLWKMLKELKSNIKLLPQYQTAQERESIMLGQLSMNDLTIDLDTPQGRNAAAKMYMPMAYKIVNQYVGKSSLSRQELMSAALQGLTSAMNEWKRKDGDEDKKVVFKTYAAYRIKQQILNDMNELYHTLSGSNSYNIEKYGASTFDAISIDGLPHDEDGDFKQDHLAMLGTSDSPSNKDEEKQWKILYDLIENNFKRRDVDVFYRYFGLNGYKREKSKDIAKELGMSEGNIRNSIINKMIMFLKKDRKAIEILSEIQDAYNEALMYDLMGLDKEMVIESLLNDDMFILLEELNKWNNKTVFQSALQSSLESMDPADARYIREILENDFEYLDGSFKKYKKIIILFLNDMYPTEPMNRKSDVALLEYMEELQEIYKKFK